MNFSKIFLSLILLFFVSCKKEAGDTPETPPSATVPVASITTAVNTVYLGLNTTKQLVISVLPVNAANKTVSWRSSNPSVARVNSDGLVQAITAGTVTITVTSNENNSIKVFITLTVLNSYDLYLAGNGAEYNHNMLGPIDFFGCYWKNGTVSLLPGGYDGARSVRAITVEGTDVYTAGHIVNPNFWHVPVLWKNGVPVILASMNNNYQQWGTGLTVLGGSAYVSSYIYGGSYTAVLNKVTGNTVTQIPLPNANGMTQSEARAVTNNGTDLFTSGSIQSNFYSIACYWKNSNTPILLSGATNYAKATAVAVTGNDVYAAGYEGCPNYGCTMTFKLWKNNSNNVTVLGSTGNTNMDITGVALAGNDVYVTGYAANAAGRYIAYLWKVNGAVVTTVQLSDGTADAYASGVAVSGNDVFVTGYYHYPDLNVTNAFVPKAHYWRLYGTDIVENFEIGQNSSYQFPNNNGKSKAYAVWIK